MCAALIGLSIALLLLGLLRSLLTDDLTGPALVALAIPVATAAILGYC